MKASTPFKERFDTYVALPEESSIFSKSAYDYLKIYDFSMYMSGIDNHRKVTKIIVLECLARQSKGSSKINTATLFKIFSEIDHAFKTETK